jgi:hypothetical protein
VRLRLQKNKNRDTKLIEILSHQYDLILAVLEENIFCIGRSRENLNNFIRLVKLPALNKV